MTENEDREKGFEIFRKGLVRRLSSTHYVAKNDPGDAWWLIELKDGRWQCDCQSAVAECSHLYASQLHRTTAKLPPEQFDESRLKCRYCGSPDLARAGFRYNSRGIVRRYRCNDCQRKFSIPHVQRDVEATPSELIWLVNEVGMLTSKLTDLLTDLDTRIEVLGTRIPDSNLPLYQSESEKS